MHTKRPGTLMLLMAMVLFVTVAMYAQPGGTPPSDEKPSLNDRAGQAVAAMELDRLARVMKSAALPLTDTQGVAVLSVLQGRETAVDMLRQSDTDQPIAAPRMHAVEALSRAAVRTVLTGAQTKIFDMMRPIGPPQTESGTGPGTSPTRSGVDQQLPSQEGPPDENDESSIIDANTGGSPLTSPAQ